MKEAAISIHNVLTALPKVNALHPVVDLNVLLCYILDTFMYLFEVFLSLISSVSLAQK